MNVFMRASVAVCVSVTIYWIMKEDRLVNLIILFNFTLI